MCKLLKTNWSGREDSNLRPPGPEPWNTRFCMFLQLVANHLYNPVFSVFSMTSIVSALHWLASRCGFWLHEKGKKRAKSVKSLIPGLLIGAALGHLIAVVQSVYKRLPGKAIERSLYILFAPFGKLPLRGLRCRFACHDVPNQSIHTTCQPSSRPEVLAGLAALGPLSQPSSNFLQGEAASAGLLEPVGPSPRPTLLRNGFGEFGFESLDQPRRAIRDDANRRPPVTRGLATHNLMYLRARLKIYCRA